MPKDPTPDVTAWIPPTEDCPTPDDLCTRQVLEDAIERIIIEEIKKGATRTGPVGLRELQWDIIIPPVKLELLTPNKRYEWSWPSEDWPCIQDFFSSVRLRLDELARLDLIEFIEELDVAFISEQAWNSFIQPRVETIAERIRQECEHLSKVEGLSGLVGLERGTRARWDLEQLAGLRLHRWSNATFKSIVFFAREVLRNG